MTGQRESVLSVTDLGWTQPVDAWDVPTLPLPEEITRPHQLAGYMLGRLLSREYRVLVEARRLRQMRKRAHLESAAREAWEQNRIRRQAAAAAAAFQVSGPR